MTAVDARFAGGPLRVDREKYPYDANTDIELICIDAPGAPQLLLFNHEAQALALAIARHLDLGAAKLLAGMLDQQIADREPQRTLRRRSDVADQFERTAELY